MFYHNTYIATIFSECMVYLWNIQVVTLQPHFHFDREDLTNNPLHQFIATKLTGKCAQSFFKHQSTSKLTFDFTSTPLCSDRLKLNHLSWLNLHLGTFY